MADRIQLTNPADGFAFDCLHAAAQGERRGGVVVVQEIFGLDEYMVADVARWAEAGFEAIAPSLFDRLGRGFDVPHAPDGFAQGRARAGQTDIGVAMGDIAAVVAELATRGPVFLVGYCYGGSLAWHAAAKVAGLAAVSSYYGSMVKDAAALDPRCPVILHFGGTDAHIPAGEVEAALKAGHPEVPVFVYERSGHGFNNELRDSDPADAALARERSIALFVAAGAAPRG